jgi:predicted transcriptional regulator of viral defense system
MGIASKKLTLIKALANELARMPQPVITSYQLGRLIFNAYLSNSIGTESLGLKKNIPDKKQYNDALRALLDAGVLSNVSGLSGNFFKVLGKPDVSPDEIICSIDPFCYISYLSAMEYHGITDRLPRTIFVSSPPPQDWKKYAIELMKKDLKEQYDLYIEKGFPQLTRPRPKKISGKLIEFKSSSHLGAYKTVQGRALRVASIGRTFLDMLRNPELCGGIQHVIDVYKEYARQYLRFILDEIDMHGNGIEKARAGYILENQADINDPRIDEWQKTVQRGGSRKLDPSAEYSSFFSERWALSLNVPSVSSNAN